MYLYIYVITDPVLCEWSFVQHPVHARDTRGGEEDGVY